MKTAIGIGFLSLWLPLASAMPPVKKGGLELWLFQPAITIDAISQTHKSADSNHGGTIIHDQTETVRVDKVSITSEAIQIGFIDATIAVGKLSVTTTILGKNIVNHFDNIGVHIWLKNPLVIPLPATIALQLRQNGNTNALEMSERETLQGHLQKQVDEIFSEASFDRNFDFRAINLSGAKEFAFKLILNSKKGQVLASLRDSMKKEIGKPAYLDRYLRDMNRFMPMPYVNGGQPAPLVMARRATPPNTWVIQEAGAEPTFSPQVQAQIPLPGTNAPWLSSVAHTEKINFLLQSYLEHLAATGQAGLPPGVKLTPQALTFEPSGPERQDIVALFAQTGSVVDPSPSHLFAIEISGDRAPIIRPWYVGGEAGQAQQCFVDAWLSADWVDTANPPTPPARMGMLLVYSLQQDGTLRLLQFHPFRPGDKKMGPASDLTKNDNVGLRFGTQLKILFLQSLLNARLATLSLKQNLTGPFQLRGIRMLGDGGARAPGEHLAEALAIDFQGMLDQIEKIKPN